MCLLNRCSAQIEYSQTGSPEAVFFPRLTCKPVLLALLPVLIPLALFFSAPSAFCQDMSDPEFVESLEEDPLAETGSDSSIEEDPLAETEPDPSFEEDPLAETGPDLELEEDPLAETGPVPGLEEDPLAETVPVLGLEEDPFTETEPDLGMDADPFDVESPQVDQKETQQIDETENLESEDQFEEQEEMQPRVTFSHKVTTVFGGSDTKGLVMLDPLLDEIKEVRFVSTYDQSAKVQISPLQYNYFRLSISFMQNYELKKKRIFDGYASLREIYTNYRKGAHQIRYGTQIFNLGRVDLDNVIDVLHMNNIMGLYTFDPDKSKDSIPAVRYNWFRGSHTATVYLSPIRQQTFGMRFTEFREEVEKKENEEEEKHVSFLRDYYGLQYQWTGDNFDARIGLFHWFDSNPFIKLEYQRVTDTGAGTLQGSFEKMLSSYNEKESRADFLTFETEAIWSDMVWKLESGIFKERNLYSYEIPESANIRLSTVRTPHVAWATSFERTFPYFYWLMIYSHRKSFDVPANSHVFLYENESALVPQKRDVVRNQASGVVVLKTPDNSLRITLLNYMTWPFKQNGFASLFTWDNYKDNLALELKIFRLATEKQKMLDRKIETNQIFLTYTQKFTAY